MSRDTIEARTCDRCGQRVEALPDSATFKEWGVVAARGHAASVIGREAAGDDLCGPCFADLVTWFGAVRAERDAQIVAKPKETSAPAPSDRHLQMVDGPDGLGHVSEQHLVDIYVKMTAHCSTLVELAQLQAQWTETMSKVAQPVFDKLLAANTAAYCRISGQEVDNGD